MIRSFIKLSLGEKVSAISSSTNPEEISLTVKGYLLSILPLLIGIFQTLDVEVAESDLLVWIQFISLAIALSVTVTGWIRKVYYMWKK